MTRITLVLMAGLVYSSTCYSISGSEALPSSQNEGQDYKIDSLFVALLSNGDASIDYNLIINSNKSNTNVTLFGDTVQNLTLTDYNETEIKYTPTEVSNRVTVNSQNPHDIHVTYATPDLVDKQNRNWTFSIFFPDKFLLKMPSQAHIIRMNPPPYLTPSGEQNLWGFGPGNVQVSYIIGPLGTREEAQASIRSVEDAIKNSKLSYEGIVLTSPTVSLEKAKSAFNQSKYFETVRYSAAALNFIQNTSQNYVSGQHAIYQAQNDIQNKRKYGYDTSEANETLSTARNLFLTGEYIKAEDLAEQAISQSSPRTELSIDINNNSSIIILGLLIAVTISIVLFTLRKRKRSRSLTVMKELSEDQSGSQFNNSTNKPDPDPLRNFNGKQNSDISESKTDDLSPLRPNISSDSPRDGAEIKDYLQKVVEEVGNVRKTQERQNRNALNLPHSGNQINDKELLEKIVYQIKLDKPYLRTEDKQLLDFLCEKQGIAFESEIRNKFVLPRTSLWRLIKRLERQELVEVKKIGGQNLIKLKFEPNSTTDQ
jgi:hypothetical protein